MTRDFGKVGHIKNLDTDAVFMVVGESDHPEIRRWKPDYRMVINLSGMGYVLGTPVPPGDLAPVHLDSPFIEWLDD